MSISASSCWKLCSRVFMGSPIADFLGTTHFVVWFLKYLERDSQVSPSSVIVHDTMLCRIHLRTRAKRSLELCHFCSTCSTKALLNFYFIFSFFFFFLIETSCERRGQRKALGRPIYLTVSLGINTTGNLVTDTLSNCQATPVHFVLQPVWSLKTMSSCIGSEAKQPLLFFHPRQLQVSCMVHALCIYQTTMI